MAWIRRPLVAGALLLGAYVVLSLLNSPLGYLGTDTGGKVATVKVMSERGDFDPDVGYWAAAWDPDGSAHGLYLTAQVGDRYVNVTTLPLVLAARPLWDLGGYRATLLLPMAGAVAAAFAARALARRAAPPAARGGWGPDTAGWAAFWVVGLASPVAVYALDLWEHAPGVALVGWAAVLLVDAVGRRPSWWRGLAAGALCGAAASMRTEAFVYVLTSVAVACLALVVWRRSWRGAVVVGATAVAGFGALVLANSALEAAVLGDAVRTGRAGSAAGSGLSNLGLRLREGVVTTLSPLPAVDGGSMAMGVLLLVLLVALARAADRPARDRDRLVVQGLAAGVVVVYAVRLVGGLGFVPGLVAASPLAAVALALGWRGGAPVDDTLRTARMLLLLGLVPLPVVVAFQYVGGAGPQWGGRYLLPSCLLLTALGVVRLGGLPRWARTGGVALSVGVTAFGLAWLGVRSHQVEEAAARLEARPEEVLVSPNGFIPREFGGSYPAKRWLSTSPARFGEAVEVVDRAGVGSFAVVEPGNATPREIPGFELVGTERSPFVGGAEFQVSAYRRR